MKSITRLLLESGIKKRDIKALRNECFFSGIDFEISIKKLAKMSFISVIGYLLLILFLLPFFNFLVDDDFSVKSYLLQILLFTLIPFLFNNTRASMKEALFYSKLLLKK
ncbi:hypothetical protein EHE21_07220 [Proteus sp. GOKU]|jgi:hypothetical protein|uniref:hypothetical protein n=1 Tax=Proteus TaxID=583 RepID=UPI001892D019|nr:MULTISPECIES: hypothetical protein [Proteus]QPB79183.1 hypothetical protein EHE21_07220 [Proteus sp. GOKU]QQP25190.1 hypothetical protein D7029_07220 [Proteus vulgaris]